MFEVLETGAFGLGEALEGFRGAAVIDIAQCDNVLGLHAAEVNCLRQHPVVLTGARKGHGQPRVACCIAQGECGAYWDGVDVQGDYAYLTGGENIRIISNFMGSNACVFNGFPGLYVQIVCDGFVLRSLNAFSKSP